MPYPEAIRLARMLADDPTTHIACDLHEWDRPWSFEWAALADLFDLTHAVNSKRTPKPYKRPWRDPGSKRHGRTNKSRAEVVAILNAHGHQISA